MPTNVNNKRNYSEYNYRTENILTKLNILVDTGRLISPLKISVQHSLNGAENLTFENLILKYLFYNYDSVNHLSNVEGRTYSSRARSAFSNRGDEVMNLKLINFLYEILLGYKIAPNLKCSHNQIHDVENTNAIPKSFFTATSKSALLVIVVLNLFQMMEHLTLYEVLRNTAIK
ncbi:hypothetical protein AGLY_002430 [Aphis glycines]|uniref:Uncharacterized protein n=1 Tax=Aphis glycines TaxID=307491 RepID=A0A6G0U4C7_APHGL|nr:hypothetical protein AGLY_002430 [Aphis glycines]